MTGGNSGAERRPGTMPGRGSARTEPVIRAAMVEDWPRMWPIWHSIVSTADTYTYDPGTTSDQARRMWIETPGIDTNLALVDGRIVGFYKIAPNQAGPGAHIANGSYMVDAEIRGLGVGRLLVEHSLRLAHELGYRGMQFNAVAATNVAAIGLYHRIGFVTVGTIPGGFHHRDEGDVDLLIMFHDLTGLD